MSICSRLIADKDIEDCNFWDVALYNFDLWETDRPMHNHGIHHATITSCGKKTQICHTDCQNNSCRNNDSRNCGCRNSTLFYHPMQGDRLSRLGTAVRVDCSAHAQSYVSQMPSSRTQTLTVWCKPANSRTSVMHTITKPHGTKTM